MLNDLISPSEDHGLEGTKRTEGIKEVAEWAQQEADRGEVIELGGVSLVDGNLLGRCFQK